jgi:hypothetical protein
MLEPRWGVASAWNQEYQQGRCQVKPAGEIGDIVGIRWYM